MTEAIDITHLLNAWCDGNSEALDRLVPHVYEELRRVARAHLRREGTGHSLQATALVHEVYVRLVQVDRLTVNGRAHFMAVAARLMRQILVDHARRKQTEKRGGDVTLVGIEEAATAAQPASVDILALDEALNALGAFDPRQRDLVELKFFAGLTIDESSKVLGLSSATVEREWAVAKAWLYRRLSGGTP